MRILIFPGYDIKKHVADSSFILMKAFAERLGKRKDCFVYWFAPEGFDEKIEGVKVQHFKKPFRTRDISEITNFDDLEDFWPLTGKYPVDAVFTNNAGIGAILKNSFALASVKKDIPVFLWEFSTKFIGDCEISSIVRENLMMHALGYTLCENIFFTKWSQDMAADDVNRYMSASLMRNFEEHSHVIPCSFSKKEMDTLVGEKYTDKPTFFFAGRFTATKGGDKVIEIIDYLFRSGKDLRIILITPSRNPRFDRLMKGRKNVEVYGGMDYKEYVKIMLRCHYGIFWQSLKMFPSTPFEWLYKGLLVAFRDCGWEKDLLPKNYPYLFKDEVGAYAIIKEFIDGWPDNLHRWGGFKDFVCRYDRDDCIDEILRLMKEKSARSYKPTSLVEELFKKVAMPKTEEQMRTELMEMAEHPSLIFSKGGSKKGLDIQYFYKLCSQYFIDDCETEEPNYVQRR